jgi:hypothetical protein
MGWIPYSSKYWQTHVVLLLHPFIPYVRSTLLKTQSGRCLSAHGKPPGTLDQGLGSLPWVNESGGKGRQVVKSRPPALNRRVENWWRGRSTGLIFLGWWALLVSLEWWGRFRLWGVRYPSHLPLEGTNRIQGLLGHNRWPLVPRVNYPNNCVSWSEAWSILIMGSL